MTHPVDVLGDWETDETDETDDFDERSGMLLLLLIAGRPLDLTSLDVRMCRTLFISKMSRCHLFITLRVVVIVVVLDLRVRLRACFGAYEYPSARPSAPHPHGAAHLRVVHRTRGVCTMRIDQLQQHRGNGIRIGRASG
jgi:hypothetical protein